jgi:hypothetical protein
MIVHGNIELEGSIELGGGTIYWQTSTSPDVLEMDCGLIVDGALNANGISINGNAGITGALTTTENISLKSTLTYNQNAGTWAYLNTASTYGLLVNYNTGVQKTGGAFQVYNGLTTPLMILDPSGNLTASGWLHPNNDAAWGMTAISDKLYLAKAGVTNGLVIDASGNIILVGQLKLPSSLGQNGQIAFGNLNSTSTPWMAFPAVTSTLYFRPYTSGMWEFYNDSSGGLLMFQTDRVRMGDNIPITWGVLGNTDDVNLYRGGANLLKTDSSFMCVGNFTTYGNINGGGYLKLGGDNYIGFSNGAGGWDVYMRRAAANVLAIDNGSGGLGTLNCSNMKCDIWQPTATGDLYPASNIRMYTSGLNIFPQSNNNGNVGGNGSGSSYYWGAVWAYYIKYKSAPSSFDAYNDFDLIRKMKTAQVDGKDIIDPETTKHLIDDHGFYESSKIDGWHLSVQRKMVQKFDENDAVNAELLDRIERLSTEIEQLKTKLAAA